MPLGKYCRSRPFVFSLVPRCKGRQKLTAALTGTGLEIAWPSAKALRDLRRRVGAAPVRHLFDVVAGPLARPTTRGVRFGPFRTVSFDGCSSIKVPESDRNVDRFGPQSRGGYPMVELMTLVETGTRALIGAVFGPTSVGETDYARRLLHHLRPDMLVLWDKGFDANAFLANVASTGAQFLGRIRANRRTPVLARLGDGSYLSVLGTLPVRIVEAEIIVTCKDGTSFTGFYRLVTTLTDARRYPAPALVALYHQRWEHESAYFALRNTLWQGRVLRSGDPLGVEQEMWAMLTLYQALRTVMVEAAESRAGTDPDRCDFTIALHTARDLVVQAAGITSGATGVIGRRILAGLLPPRRPRVSNRKVKSPISRYHDPKDDGRPDTSRTVTSLAVSILAPEPDLPATSHDDRHTPPDDRRKNRVLDLLDAEPDRHWHPRDLARHLGDVTLGTMRRQLDRWARQELINKTGPATYTSQDAPLPPAQMR
ncbi:transposase [Streptomyces achromogenes]|uniref:transposase n=1 Tax=Streptomyces achromogenes TaxID=67255 RepID=UPI00358E2417